MLNEKKREWKGKERTRQLLGMVEEKVYSRQRENRGRFGNIWENLKLAWPEWAGTNGDEGEGREGSQGKQWSRGELEVQKRPKTKMARLYTDEPLGEGQPSPRAVELKIEGQVCQSYPVTDSLFDMLNRQLSHFSWF